MPETTPLDFLNTAQNVAAAGPATAHPSADTAELFGIRLIGATPENLHKLLLTLGFIALALLVGWLILPVVDEHPGARTADEAEASTEH